MLTDQFEGSVGADLGDGIEVIAAKENTEVDKLDKLAFKVLKKLVIR